MLYIYGNFEGISLIKGGVLFGLVSHNDPGVGSPGGKGSRGATTSEAQTTEAVETAPTDGDVVEINGLGLLKTYLF